MKGADRVAVNAPRVLYLVISGAPAPEGLPSLVTLLQKSGWRVVVFSTPAGTWFADLDELEQLTGQPVRWEYRMPGTGQYRARGHRTGPHRRRDRRSRGAEGGRCPVAGVAGVMIAWARPALRLGRSRCRSGAGIGRVAARAFLEQGTKHRNRAHAQSQIRISQA